MTDDRGRGRPRLYGLPDGVDWLDALGPEGGWFAGAPEGSESEARLVRDVATFSLAGSSVSAMASLVRGWFADCVDRGVVGFPVAPERLAGFLTRRGLDTEAFAAALRRLDAGTAGGAVDLTRLRAGQLVDLRLPGTHRPSTLAALVSALDRMHWARNHPLPGADPLVQSVLSALRHLVDGSAHGPAALDATLLDRVVEVTLAPGPAGFADSALVHVAADAVGRGVSAGWLAGVRHGVDGTLLDDGGLRYALPRGGGPAGVPAGTGACEAVRLAFPALTYGIHGLPLLPRVRGDGRQDGAWTRGGLEARVRGLLAPAARSLGREPGGLADLGSRDVVVRASAMALRPLAAVRDACLLRVMFSLGGLRRHVVADLRWRDLPRLGYEGVGLAWVATDKQSRGRGAWTGLDTRASDPRSLLAELRERTASHDQWSGDVEPDARVFRSLANGGGASITGAGIGRALAGRFRAAGLPVHPDVDADGRSFSVHSVRHGHAVTATGPLGLSPTAAAHLRRQSQEVMRSWYLGPRQGGR